MKFCGLEEDNQLSLFNKIFTCFYILFLTIVFAVLLKKLLNNLQKIPIKVNNFQILKGEKWETDIAFYYYLLSDLYILSDITFNKLRKGIYIHQCDPNGVQYDFNHLSRVSYYLHNIYLTIYFMRCLRIGFAFDINKSLTGRYYNIMKNEDQCCLICTGLAFLLYTIPICLFAISGFLLDGPYTLDHKRTMAYNYSIQQSGQFMLLISLYVIRKANVKILFKYTKKYPIKCQKEVITAIFIEFSISVTKFFMAEVIRVNLCFHIFPTYYLMDSLRIILLLLISVVLPIIYIEETRDQFPYSIVVTNFQLFLSQPQCIRIFFRFLQQFDNKQIQMYQFSLQKMNFLCSNLIDRIRFNQGSSGDNDNTKYYQDLYCEEEGSLDTKKSQIHAMNYSNSIGTEKNSKTISNCQDRIQQESFFDKKIQTSECFIVWTELTQLFYMFLLYYFKFQIRYDKKKLKNDQVDPLNLEEKLIEYMVQLIGRIELNSIMPVRLAQHIQIQFKQYKESLSSKNDFLGSSNWSRAASYNSLNLIISKGGTEDEESDSFECEYLGVVELIFGVRQLMFEIISQIFNAYFKSTKSYHTLSREYRNNEVIQQRLYNLNLSTEFR